MTTNCPNCGRANRSGARFCTACGANLPAASVAGSSGQMGTSTAKSGIGSAVAKASAVIAPVARQAAAKGWGGSKRGMSLLAQVVTGGGRAAYSELFGSLPVVGGQVAGPLDSTTASMPTEPAALAFMAALLGGWLVFTAPPLAQGILVIAGPIILLLLSWLGLRQPYFTAMTFAGLVGRLRNRGRVPQVSIYKFRIVEHPGGQPLDVVMIGSPKGSGVVSGAIVELWGIRHPGRNELRAWRVQSVDVAGQLLGVLAVPRLIPLVVALFLPAIMLLLVWLLVQIL